MKILIVGAGRAGLEVAIQLSRIGHAVTIVDTDAAVARRASEQFGLVAIAGDATTAEVLDDAMIGDRTIAFTIQKDGYGFATLNGKELIPRTDEGLAFHRLPAGMVTPSSVTSVVLRRSQPSMAGLCRRVSSTCRLT